ncbi:MAG: hypothetical protein WD804_00550 [Gemmatimonadota bacterium]
MTHPSLLGILAQIRATLRRRAGAALACTAAGIVGLVLVLAWFLAGTDGWTPGTPIPLLLLLGGGIALAGIGLLVFSRLARWTGEAGISGEIERSAHLPDGSVRAQAELLTALPRGVSGPLARAGEGVLLSRLQGSVGQLAGEPGRIVGRWLRVAGVTSVVAVVIVAALVALTPDRTRMAWAGLTTPAALLRPPPLAPLELRPGDARLPRGEAPRVEIVADGRDSVTLHWQEVGALVESRTLPVGGGAATADLPPLESETRYWATAVDGAQTGEFLLTPVDPSLVADLLIEVFYPPHTRLASELVRGAPESLLLPEGTTLSITGSVEGSGGEVSLVGEGDAVAVRLAVEGNRFTGRWRPLRSERLEWVVSGGREGALLPPPLDIEIVPDATPAIAFPVPGADGVLPLSLRLPILVEATDDYGVAWIELESMLRGSDGTTREPVRDRVETGERPTVTLRSVLDFNAWGILPGEEIQLRARAADNAPSPHIVESAWITLRMPAESELRELARAQIDEAASRTEELLDRAAREAAEIHSLQREEELQRARANPSTPRDQFEQREELTQALERQSTLAQDTDEVRERLEELREALAEEAEEEEGAESSLQERIEELEKLLEEVLGPEGRERLEELLELLRQGEMPQTPGQILDEIAQRQEEMQSRLEQALERLRRSALEESMRATEEEIQSLMETQAEVADSLAAGQGSETQEELARRTESVEDRVAQLEERLRTGGDEAPADRAEQANREMAAAREAMEEAARQSRQGNDSQAREEAQRAAEELQSALQELQEAREDFGDDLQAAMEEALRRGAQDALSLARRQGELREEFPNAGPNRRGEFEGDEVALLEGLRNLANELAAATLQNPALGGAISLAAGRATEAAERAIDGLRGSPSVQPATDAAAGNIQAALQDMALLALSGAGQQSGGSPAEAGASAEEILAQMEALAQAQQSINRDSRALGQDPGTDGRTARLEELARTQESIASSLGDLSREPGAGQIPGSLEALAEEAQQIAEELNGGRIDGTTLDRQDHFLDRLLSAGRTLERDGPTEEREGTTAGAVERRIVSPLPDYLLEVLALPIPAPSELDALTPGQRRLVLDYFERVNRRQAAEGNP